MFLAKRRRSAILFLALLSAPVQVSLVKSRNVVKNVFSLLSFDLVCFAISVYRQPRNRALTEADTPTGMKVKESCVKKGET